MTDVEPAVRRFACTQCGKCCNRSPEVALSEAAALADIFVFRLMFRLYWLPDRPGDDPLLATRAPQAAAAFYERKRLLSAFAAHKSAAKRRYEGRSIAYARYLTISALALDTRPGHCAALRGSRCGIYDRRPLGCRSVPFHYSSAEAAAETVLEAFVDNPGFDCDTGETAGIVLEGGRIVSPEVRAARAQAIAVAEDCRRWNQAILRGMRSAPSAGRTLPSLREVESNAEIGATTISMRVAWQVAADAGIIDQTTCDRLVKRQLATIDEAMAYDRCPPESLETLVEMRAEYHHHLNGGG